MRSRAAVDRSAKGILAFEIGKYFSFHLLNELTDLAKQRDHAGRKQIASFWQAVLAPFHAQRSQRLLPRIQHVTVLP